MAATTQLQLKPFDFRTFVALVYDITNNVLQLTLAR